ncbi:hypothetical protein CHBEV_329 [Choristoneura biennis entomopoxvirus]|uniref:Uncharacterized protein n=1 Tax=Choristoneura biennis entomopoxvirus TaxID=10288 RepID=A0A916P139_CBEPV|nr:hypothetical protein CHBEV_006 [Choristoneura biennis entomopoxvirus]YP_008004399.1 hypothetical protein CHBEV_329 [Choristoneura biennis entomopoxvirus]CCU55574.1 hypothetical protein CHBEV_006 [Choristoneura biennis entomopoxvirus]CCU55897.1 hypothetical protein CHBEV_329 [Choristoneura biennis entomopoxvirus]
MCFIVIKYLNYVIITIKHIKINQMQGMHTMHTFVWDQILKFFIGVKNLI